MEFSLKSAVSVLERLRTGIHPAIGQVTRQEHLFTWCVDDVHHVAQIARVMAKQYKGHVGPWIAYLRILQ